MASEKKLRKKLRAADERQERRVAAAYAERTDALDAIRLVAEGARGGETTGVSGVPAAYMFSPAFNGAMRAVRELRAERDTLRAERQAARDIFEAFVAEQTHSMQKKLLDDLRHRLEIEGTVV